jgi:hypothetical protein
MNRENEDLTAHNLAVLRLVADNAGNTTLAEITDRAISTQDEDEVEALFRLYHQEFPDDALVTTIWGNTRVRR